MPHLPISTPCVPSIDFKTVAASNKPFWILKSKGVPGQANYAAAKGGLIAATRSLANEVGRKGITVNAVAPGFIKTEMTEDLNQAELTKMIPLNRFGEAEEVADLVAFLASDKAAYITGECISINGGLYM